MFYQYNHLGSPDYVKIEKGGNFSFPPHLHQCFEIIVLTSGEMEVSVDDKTFTLKKNDAVLVFPNQIHSLKSVKSQHVLCIFSPKIVQAYSTKLGGKTPKDNKFTPDPFFINALLQLENSSDSVLRKGVLYSLCAQFNVGREYFEKQADNQKLLHKIFSFVEENFTADCSLSELCENVGRDYSYLSRFFKKSIGISFNTYVTHFRLSHACYLMENTSLPIVQCAFESGFSSLRSFNRSFKEFIKLTPKEYRKSIK